MSKREQDRRKAYILIKRFAISHIPLVPQEPSDFDLDDLFTVPPGTLRALREGKMDPPRKLVSKFGKLAGPLLPPETNSVMVTPFLSK